MVCCPKNFQSKLTKDFGLTFATISKGRCFVEVGQQMHLSMSLPKALQKNYCPPANKTQLSIKGDTL